jgi:tripartite-type tricarboxylate transporter receptor subunit TctC
MHDARSSRLRTLAVLAGLAAAIVSPAAHAQYPNKPVKLVVPFIAGSAPDVLARSVADKLGARLGQAIVVENRGGAGGNVGAEFTAKQPNDGYTIMLATSSHLVNPSLYGKVAYDPVRDFAPVALLIRMPSLLIVPLDSPAKNVVELIALAKANPGKMNFGSGGNGSQAHLAGAMFKAAAGIDVVHVPYKGAPEIITSMLSGQTQLAFPTFSTALPQVRGGRLRGLAVTGAKRNPQLPDVPTLLESMPNGFDLEAWFGIWAPAGTPPDIVRRLNADIAAVLADPEFRAKLAADGSEVVTGGTPEEFAGYVKAETAKWARVVRESGAKID